MVQIFEMSPTNEILEEESSESLVIKALKSKRLLNQGIYVNTTSVCPTSNHLERLFSQCKLIRTQLRQSMLPGTLEMILFLKVNRRYWTALDVELALNSWSGEDFVASDEDFSEDSD